MLEFPFPCGGAANLGGDDRAPLTWPALPLTASYEALDLVCVGLSQLPHGTDTNDRNPRRRVTVNLRDNRRKPTGGRCGDDCRQAAGASPSVPNQ